MPPFTKSVEIFRDDSTITARMEKHKRVPKDLAAHVNQGNRRLSGRCQLIARNGWIHFRGPGENAAVQIMDFSETCFAQEVHRLRRTLAAAAVGNDFVGGIEFVNAPWKFPKWNQMPVEIADLVFLRLAHIRDKKTVAAVQTLLQVTWRDFR